MFFVFLNGCQSADSNLFMFRSLKVERELSVFISVWSQILLQSLFSDKGRIKQAVQYMSYLPLFDYNAYVLLNPENAERIFRLFHFESKTKMERYCLSAGFDEIIRSFDTHCKGLVFATVQELLEWQWSSTYGVFDPSLVTEERLQKYLAPYTDEDGKLSLDFRGMKHEKVTASRLKAVKKEKEHS